MKKKGRSALFTSLDLNGHNKEVTLLESAEHYASYKQTVFFNDIRLDMEWGKTPTKLPFSILLNDFMVQHYFGSSMVSSYESDIHLQDEAKNTFLTQKVSINHPLRYKGYSIFQTSSFIYGKTVLHINYNPFVSVIYLGYILVCMGFFLLLFSQNSYFIKLKNSLQT
jgi:cytochrome c biogenesis protein ResB